MQRRALLVLALAGILGALYASGFFHLVHEPQRVRDVLEALGVWAPILYVVAFAVLEPFFVPAIAFIIPGALFFSFAELFWLSWLGAVGAGVDPYAAAASSRDILPRLGAALTKLRSGAERGVRSGQTLWSFGCLPRDFQVSILTIESVMDSRLYLNGK